MTDIYFSIYIIYIYIHICQAQYIYIDRYCRLDLLKCRCSFSAGFANLCNEYALGGCIWTIGWLGLDMANLRCHVDRHGKYVQLQRVAGLNCPSRIELVCHHVEYFPARMWGKIYMFMPVLVINQL